MPPSLEGEDSPSAVPFVLVVTRDLVARRSETVPLLRLWGPRGRAASRAGSTATTPRVTWPATTRSRAATPPGAAYLLVGVERGEEFCNVRPEDATRTIRDRGRSPLTIDEGIALVTQVPQVLEKNKCFMLAGSRRHDRRVPGAVDQRASAEAGLVLGRQPAHLAGHRVRLGTAVAAVTSATSAPD